MAQTDPSEQSPFATLDQSSPFGAKPQQLDQPEPGAQEAQDFLNSIESDAQPEIAAQPEGDLDPAAQEFLAGEAEQEGLGLPPSTQSPAEDFTDVSPAQMLDEAITTIGDLGARVKASFAGTELSKLKSVRSSFPDAEVTRDDKGNIFIDEEGKPTRKLDKESIGLIENIAGDLIADNARLITEGTIENLFRIKGAIEGMGVASVPAVAIEGAIGANVALSTADFIQEKIFGIERDPERASRLTESALATSFGAGFNFLGARMARSKAARDLLKKGKEKVVETLGGVKDKIQEVEGLLKQVNESGLVQEGKEIKFTPGQKLETLGDEVHLPEVKILEGEMSRENNYRAFRKETSKSIEGAYDSARKLLRQEAGVPTDLGESIGSVISDEKMVWGKHIGKFRKGVDQAAAGAPQSAANTVEAVERVAENLGIDMGSFMALKGKTPAATRQLRVEHIKKMSGLDRNKAEVLSENLHSLVSVAKRKGDKLSLKDIESSYTALRSPNRNERCVRTRPPSSYW